MGSAFEKIEHHGPYPARIFITSIDACGIHWHTDYEVILVLKGTVNVYCGSHPFTMQRGDLYLFNSRVIHGVTQTNEENLVLILQFSPVMIETKEKTPGFSWYFYMNSAGHANPPAKPFDYFRSCMAALGLSNQETGDSSILRTHSMLLSFLADLLDYVQYDIRRNPVEQVPGSGASDLYDRITDYTENHLRSADLSKDLCREIGLSEKSLYRYLKSTLGITFKDLVDISRAEKACSLLKNTRKPIPMIWDECGYTSEVSFYRNFRKQLGITPNEYRIGRQDAGSGYEMSGEGGYLYFNLGEANRILQTIIDHQGAIT